MTDLTHGKEAAEQQAMAQEKAELAGRLRTWRIARGLSQDDVGDELGICRSAVSEIERGRRRVSAIELLQYSELLQVSAEMLLYGEEEGR